MLRGSVSVFVLKQLYFHQEITSSEERLSSRFYCLSRKSFIILCNVIYSVRSIDHPRIHYRKKSNDGICAYLLYKHRIRSLAFAVAMLSAFAIVIHCTVKFIFIISSEFQDDLTLSLHLVKFYLSKLPVTILSCRILSRSELRLLL